MNRLIIFGERPGPNTDPSRPLYPHTATGAAARLIELLGISQEEYLNEERVVRYNVVDNEDDYTTGARGLMRKRIDFHLRMEKDPHFLFLGKGVLNAVPAELRDLEFGKIRGRYLMIPHPSGRNRYYNSQASTSLIKQSLKEFARRIWGSLDF